MSAEKEAGDSAGGDSRAANGVSNQLATIPDSQPVICGLDGRVIVTFGPDPEPVQGKTTVVDLTNPQPRPRWRTNRRRSEVGHVAPETLRAIELNAWRSLFAVSVLIHFLHIH